MVPIIYLTMDRLIKHYFPTEEVSEASQRERAVISPPINYLHVWWARRPLIGSRVTIAASAVRLDGPPSEDFIRQFLEAVALTRRGKRPERPSYVYNPDQQWFSQHSDISNATLLDPFAGGGAIPFEALRLGFKKVVAIEYNPVAYLILKATLEYPMKYGKRLARDVERWARWLLRQAKERLKKYYPRHPKGEPTSYIWVRVYRCPICGALVPSLSQPILSKDKNIGLKVEYNNGGFTFKIVPAEEAEKTARGTTSVTCPRGHLITSEELTNQYKYAMESWERDGKYGHHPAVLAAVKLSDGHYVSPTEEMLDAVKQAEEDLRREWDKLIAEGLIPTQRIPENTDTARPLLQRGINYFYKLFSARQLLVNATIIRLIREAYNKILEETHDKEYARAVVLYLGFGLSKLLNYNSTICGWDKYGKGSIINIFSHHAYKFTTDFGELDLLVEGASIHWALFSNTGVVSALKKIVELLEDAKGEVEIILGDAKDPSTYARAGGKFEYIITDPPYYANVQYSELSDYFYVWLKCCLGHLYPEVFASPLTPKEEEVVVNKSRGKTEKDFEQGLREAFEIARLSLAEDGVLVVMYAHRSHKGLKTMFRAALDAGFIPFAVWGFASEQPRSLHIVGKAAVKSVLVLALKPRSSTDNGGLWDANLKARIRSRIRELVSELSERGFSHTDMLLMAMGAAFEVVGQMWPLKTADGEQIEIEDVLRFTTTETINIILEKTVGETDPLSAMYLLARVAYGEPSHENLRYLSYGCNYPLEEFIKRYTTSTKQRNGDKVYELRALTDIHVKPNEEKSPKNMLDVLALAIKFYLRGQPEKIRELLAKTCYSDKKKKAFVAYIRAILTYSTPTPEEKKALQYVLLSLGVPAEGQTTLLQFSDSSS